jgi:hypothetical protein
MCHGLISGRSPLFLAVLLAVSQADGAATTAASPISFNNQIQPILSEYCYHCHGPDSAARKPKKHPLRLDREQFAFEPRDNGKPVIVKGDPKSSELVRRITATDDDIMPPASERKTLKPEEIALLQQWVAEGAKYEKHWSQIPPIRPPVPEAGKSGSQNPIDRFVADKLAQSGLKPNPTENRARLFRRVSFDLTGLPPTPEALHRFLADKSPEAYEKAVDEMLASDASAEHFARPWLDAVRYADTQGIHHDHSRTIWPYRDWVIAAFKSNERFDQFTIEQLAGDMLPNATLDQKIASGYNRLLPTTGEGGAIPEEYLAIYARDRVETTSGVWLGLTAGCANCHDHKFDPLTSKEFYSLTAFFRNNTQPALDSPTSGDVAPMVFVPAKADRQRWDVLTKDISKTKAAVEARRKSAKPDFEKWLYAQLDVQKPGPAEITKIGQTVLPLPEGEGRGEGEHTPQSSSLHTLSLPLVGTNFAYRGTAKGTEITWPGAQQFRPGPYGAAPEIGKGAIISNAMPVLSRTGKASYGAMIRIEDKPNGAVLSRMDLSDNYRGWDLFLTEGRPTVHIIDKWPDIALKVTAKKVLSPGEWHHVIAVFDGTLKGAEAIQIYVDGIAADLEVNNNTLGPNIETKAPLRLGGRSDKDVAADTITGGKVFLQDLAFFDHALNLGEVAHLAANGLLADFLAAETNSVQRTNRLFNVYMAGFDAPTKKFESKLQTLKTEEQQIKVRGASTLVFEEKKNSEPTAFVLTRGNYAAKGDKVSAATPAALPPMPSDQPHNRLGLARWLVSRDNPLTARVTVNRLWSQMMGIGIVETTGDFGVMGARPTNQPLLDWLAVEFMDSGWDFRHMAKLIVTSATYRQSEKVSKEKLEKDPQNRLFARGPHVRLDAEQIRDQALAASGLLVSKIGGPPVKPYQPEGIWEDVAMKDSNTRFYKQDKGEALYRRSIYTFWKRVAPPPSMEILNAPTREVLCTRRDRTDTPLQALVTMNDPEFVEAARHLAAKALRSDPQFDKRLDQITEALLARRFTSAERAVAKDLEEHAQKEYAKNPDAAKSLLTVGESPADNKLPAPDLAAWTLVASQIMNLDESLTK